MSKKPKATDVSKDLWINPKANIKGPEGNRAWDNSGNITPSSGSRAAFLPSSPASSFLELADLALGIKKVTPKKKKAAAASAGTREDTTKTDPYST